MGVLDVGSGTNPLFLGDSDVIHVDRERENPHLEVVCDAHQLPFIDNAFQLVHGSHILEHMNKPLQFLRELKRVSSRRVVVRVPNASFFVASTANPEHLFSWNQFTLENLLHKVFDSVNVQQHKRWRLKPNNKLRTLKFLLLSKFFGNDELFAVCS